MKSNRARTRNIFQKTLPDLGLTRKESAGKVHQPKPFTPAPEAADTKQPAFINPQFSASGVRAARQEFPVVSLPAPLAPPLRFVPVPAA